MKDAESLASEACAHVDDRCRLAHLRTGEDRNVMTGQQASAEAIVDYPREYLHQHTLGTTLGYQSSYVDLLDNSSTLRDKLVERVDLADVLVLLDKLEKFVVLVDSSDSDLLFDLPLTYLDDGSLDVQGTDVGGTRLIHQHLEAFDVLGVREVSGDQLVHQTGINGLGIRITLIELSHQLHQELELTAVLLERDEAVDFLEARSVVKYDC